MVSRRMAPEWGNRRCVVKERTDKAADWGGLIVQPRSTEGSNGALKQARPLAIRVRNADDAAVPIVAGDGVRSIGGLL
jgi:hypothetical protein